MTSYIYVGSYTQSRRGEEHRDTGIFRYEYQNDGSLRFLAAEKTGQNPSFLTVHPNKRYLFSVNELNQGEVSAFTISPRGTGLEQLNHQPTNGAAPCYLSTDPTGRWLLSANYSGGSLAVHPIQADGRLGPMADHVQHHGTGPNEGRQVKAHAHSIEYSPGGQYVICCDLGLDRVLVYTLDEMTGKLSLHSQASAEPGAGPRHFAFHPRLPCLYVANELGNTVTLNAWDEAAGVITPVQSWSTLPDGYGEESSVADIHLHPSGNFLYVSNRGHNSLAIYAVSPQDGSLALIGFEPTGGAIPRNFAISPDGRFVYVANQMTDNIVSFSLDSESGKLTATGNEYQVPSPVCIRFFDL